MAKKSLIKPLKAFIIDDIRYIKKNWQQILQLVF